MKLDNYYYLEYSDYYKKIRDGNIRFKSPKNSLCMAYWIEHLVLGEIIRRLQVQSQQQVRLTRNTFYNLTLVPGHG